MRGSSKGGGGGGYGEVSFDGKIFEIFHTHSAHDMREENLMIDVLYAKDESFEFMISTYSTNALSFS